jgi:hypothetical protein
VYLLKKLINYELSPLYELKICSSLLTCVFIYFDDLARCLVLFIINVRILSYHVIGIPRLNSYRCWTNLHWFCHWYTAILIIRLSPEQSGKVEYKRERLLGIANEFIYLLAIPSSLSRSYSTFPLCSGDNLNWNSCILVYRFYVNPDSKYLHVRFVICAGSNAFINITLYDCTCLLWPYTKALTKYN